MTNRDEKDLLKDWDYEDIKSEINLLYTYLESIRDRVYRLIKNPDSRIEKETLEYIIEKRLVEILLIRSYNNHELAHLYANLYHYADKVNCYKEDVHYIRKVYWKALNTFYNYCNNICLM